MQILEPLLIKQDQGVMASGQLSQQVEFNLAALEGILLLGVMGTLGEDVVEVDDIDSSLALSLNPNDSAASLQLLLAGNPDVFWYFQKIARAVGTPATFQNYLVTTPYLDFATVGGLLMLTNPSAHYHSDIGTQVATISMYYKRVLLDANELIPFVALRRR